MGLVVGLWTWRVRGGVDEVEDSWMGAAAKDEWETGSMWRRRPDGMVKVMSVGTYDVLLGGRVTEVLVGIKRSCVGVGRVGATVSGLTWEGKVIGSVWAKRAC